MFPSAAPRGNIEILGKQNELFPSGPVIKCLLGSKHGNLIQVCNLYIILTLSLMIATTIVVLRNRMQNPPRLWNRLYVETTVGSNIYGPFFANVYVLCIL